METKLFKDYDEYKQYIESNPDGKCNGCTQEFLDKYDITLEEYSEMNENFINSRCFNCWLCDNCDECKDCQECHYCSNCESIKRVHSVANCKGNCETKLFKNLDEFKEYIRNNREINNLDNLCNGCTQEFLDKYEITLEKYSEMNKEYGNVCCWNCWCCKMCIDCYDCIFCTSCNKCIDCEDCWSCRNCEDCNNCNDIVNEKSLKNDDDDEYEEYEDDNEDEDEE